MPRTTNADRILSEARERLNVARLSVETAEGQLGIARAAFNAHQMAYEALAKALAPKPRRKAEPKPAAPKQAEQTETKPAKDPKCGVCYETEDHPNHDTEHYLSAHPFDMPKSVQRAGRRSSRKESSLKADGASAVSSETETGDVSDVTRAASAGD